MHRTPSRVGWAQALAAGLVFALAGVGGCRDEPEGTDAGTGGRAGGGGADPSWEEDGRLPTAFLGVHYRTELHDATDGPSRLTLYTGSLPPGLTLGDGGTIEGTPQREGQWSFLLRRETSSGAELRHVRLRVSRKRWVAYRSDQRALGQHLLYLANLGRSTPEVTLLTADVQVRAEVLAGHYHFAPGEEAIAYLVDATRDGVRELHGADLRFGIASPPQRLDHGAPVRSFAWSPDARRIAYVSEEPNGLQAYVTSWPFDGSRSAVGPAGGEGRISWVHGGLLVFEARGGGSAVARRAEDGFEVVSTLPMVGRVAQARGERFLLGQDAYHCAGAWHAVDLTTDALDSAPWPSVLRGAAGLEHSARIEEDMLVLLGPPLRGGAREVDRLPLGSCDAVSWSGDGRWLVTLDEERRVRVSDVGGARVNHRVVSGSYGEVLEWPRPELDPSGRWLRFHDRQMLYLAHLTEGTLGSASPVGDLLPLARAAAKESRFTASGLLMVLAEGESGAHVYQLDLEHTTEPARIVASPSPESSPSALAGGLADGSWVGWYARPPGGAEGGDGPVELWVAPSRGADTVEPVRLTPPLDCLREMGGGPQAPRRCESARDALFQP